MLGLTSYPHGHPFGTQFLRFAGNGFAVGRLPVTENLVHFFVSRPSPSTGITTESAAREYVLEKLQDCPDEIADMVRRCDAAETKTLTKVWYRSPWQVLLGRFQRGTVTVAGDAMHVMGPYIGQGGSAALEDAVVLARTLSRSVPDGVAVVDGNGSTRSRELQLCKRRRSAWRWGNTSGRGGQGCSCCLSSLTSSEPCGWPSHS